MTTPTSNTPWQEVSRALDVIENVWLHGPPPLPTDLPENPAIAERLQRILDEIIKVQGLALAISRGDISQSCRGKGLTLGCLKSLAANLRHLTWQTQMIAAGDFSQHVDFMGEFAEAFNSMAQSLQEARARLQKREAELSRTNHMLEAQIFERQLAEAQLRQTNETLKERLAEIEMLQGQLREQAIKDPLTNLFNRRYLQETLERELAHAVRADVQLPAMLIDIDFFKKLNDQYGHKAGDLMLVQVAEVLRGKSRRSDIACRFGGEEFVVVLPGATFEDALIRAEEFRSVLQETTIDFQDSKLHATLSAGVAAFPQHGTTSDQLLQAADAALYAAKDAGRNCIRAASTMQPPSVHAA